MRVSNLLGGALLLLVAAPVASAQPFNCADPTTQYEMTACAVQDYEAADAELNRAYGVARDMARRLDRDLAPDEVTAEVILRDAQRAWIPFRDQACEAESLLARGGTMQPQLFHMCLTRLTRQRTDDLVAFGQGL